MMGVGIHRPNIIKNIFIHMYQGGDHIQISGESISGTKDYD